MVYIGFIGFFAVSQLIRATYGHITLEDIDSLTSITKDCNDQIRNLDLSHFGNPTQDLLSGNLNLEDDVEDVVAASLTYLDRELLKLLNVPVQDIAISRPDCPAVRKSYHGFMASTTKFLQAVDEKQRQFRWDTESTVFNALGFMQSLWASRTANEEHLSFIEQQLRLYKASNCFENVNDILRRDVEVVEYLNDLIDLF